MMRRRSSSTTLSRNGRCSAPMVAVAVTRPSLQPGPSCLAYRRQVPDQPHVRPVSAAWAGRTGDDSRVNENNGAGRGVIDTIAHTIESNTSRRAYGEPVTVGEVTVIPAARVIGRGGGGGGGGV